MEGIALIHDYLGRQLGGVMKFTAAFTCDVLPQQGSKNELGFTPKADGHKRNPTPIPCSVQDLTGREMWIGGKPTLVSGTFVTLPAILNGRAVTVEHTDKLRVHRRGAIPERTYGIDHVGDGDGVQIVLKVTKVGAGK
jgi:hypothetical protein